MTKRFTKADIEKLDFNDLSRMSEQELRAVDQTLRDITNKRVKRMETSGDISPATKHFMENRVKSMRDLKSRNEVYADVMQQLNFTETKTSTIKGWQKVNKATSEKLGGEVGKKYKKSPTMRKRFWNNFNKFKELHPGYDSEQVIQAIKKAYAEGKTRRADIFEYASQILEGEQIEDYDDMEGMPDPDELFSMGYEEIE